MIVMTTLGQQGTIAFLNRFLHGLDTTRMIRMDVPLIEALFGIIQTFVLGWIIAACIADFYNTQVKIIK